MDRNNKMEMRKKQIAIALAATLSIFFIACTSQMNEPTQNNILGSWKGEGKAELIFYKDQTFTGNLIPAEFAFFPSDSFKNVKFSGSGKWILRKGASNWEVNLDFDKVTGINKNGCSFPLLVAGKNGILENQSPWYLFIWKEEEGGQQYIFTKQYKR